MKTGVCSTGTWIGLEAGYSGPSDFGQNKWPDAGLLKLAPHLEEHSGDDDRPAFPSDADRLGGDVTGNLRGTAAGRRQRDRERHESREHALRGFVTSSPESANVGSPRPDPGVASLTCPDSLSESGEGSSGAVRDLVPESSLQDGDLGSLADAASMEGPTAAAILST